MDIGVSPGGIRGKKNIPHRTRQFEVEGNGKDQQIPQLSRSLLPPPPPRRQLRTPS